MLGCVEHIATSFYLIWKFQLRVKTVCIAIPWKFSHWSKTRPLHQRPLLASGNWFYNSSYKPSFRSISLIQVTPSSLLLSLIYQRGLCIKIKSNFTKAVERPSVCATASIVTLCAPLAITFWAWDQYQFCRTSSRIKPRRCAFALPEFPLRILRLTSPMLVYKIIFVAKRRIVLS